MNLASLAQQILLENEIVVQNMDEEFVLSEMGYEFLKAKLEKLNKKTIKWGVEPIQLKLNRVEEQKAGTSIFGEPFNKKFYYVTLIGKPPTVEGYTFIGKVEHTPGGENILNIAPNSPVKNLPDTFRTAKGVCDVCKHNRERFNTFILQIDKEDSERFPDKKAGDLIQVGSACLKRFLPDLSVSKFMNYAKLIELIRNIRGGGDEYDDDYDEYEKSGPNAYRGHVNTDTLMAYICLVYTVRGEYIPKSKADPYNGKTATAEEAVDVLFDRGQKMFVSKQAVSNKTFVSQAKVLADKVNKWMKEQDFNKMGQYKPEMATYFGNLQVITHSPSIRVKKRRLFGCALQSYLHWERKQAQAQNVGPKKFVGRIGERINFNGLVKSQKAFPSQFGPRGGMVILYKFEDLDGNNIQWWANTNLNLKDGQRYSMSGIVKKQEVDKWSQQPTTIIKNVRLEKD
jgi:hypothetical protein